MGLNNGLVWASHLSGNADAWVGSNGTNNGATPTTDKNGVSGGALDFDGSNDSVDTGVPYSNDFTWSTWFNSDTAGINQNVMTLIKTGNTDYRLFIQKNTSNLITFGYDDNSEVATVPGSSVSTNTWYHVVLTKSGESWKLYLNGVLDVSKTTSSFDTYQLTDTVNIGRYSSGIVHFNGKIDETRIYDRALSEYEILQLYVGYDSEDNTIGTLNHGLQAGYHMEDTSDFSGNGNTLSYTGTSLTTDKNGVAGKARLFNGSSDYITGTDIIYPNNFTISMWYYLNSGVSTDNPELFDHYESGGNRICFFGNGTSNRAIRWIVKGSSNNFDRVTSELIGEDEWHFITMKRSGDIFTLYKDGVQIDTITLAVGTINPDAPFYISKYGIGSAGWFSGKIDEPRIYNRALTPFEILQLYKGYDTEADLVHGTQTIGCQAYYKLDNDVTDSSGNGNNGTNNGADLSATGIVNQGADFDGSNDRIEGTADTNYFGATPTYTSLSFWFYTTDKTKQQSLINTYNSSSGADDNSMSFEYQGNNNRFYTQVTCAGSRKVEYYPSWTADNNRWYHITVTYDQTDKVHIYVDNTEIGTGGSFSSLCDFTEGDNLNIGASYYNGNYGNFLKGKIDEVLISSRVLLQEEIDYLYANGSPTEDQQYPFEPSEDSGSEGKKLLLSME